MSETVPISPASPSAPATTVTSSRERMDLNDCSLLLFVILPSQLKFKHGAMPSVPVLRGMMLGHEFKAAFNVQPNCAAEFARVRSLLKICWVCALLALAGLVGVISVAVLEPTLTTEYPQPFVFGLMTSLLLVGAMQLLSHDLYKAIKLVVVKYNG